MAKTEPEPQQDDVSVPPRGHGPVARSVRGLTAAAIAVAIVVNYLDYTTNPANDPVNFFSYFTILSNLLALYLMAGQALTPRWMDTNAGFRGAVTLYMTITMLVYAFLLRPIAADVGNYRPWIDFIEHTAAPVVVLQDWLLFPPMQRIQPRAQWVWLVFPAVYLAYSLVRGPMADWYPYPFLDPAGDGGYVGVAIWSVVIVGVFVAVGTFLRRWVNGQVTSPPSISERPGLAG